MNWLVSFSLFEFEINPIVNIYFVEIGRVMFRDDQERSLFSFILLDGHISLDIGYFIIFRGKYIG